MSFPTIEVEKRDVKGTGRLRRLRDSGIVPGVMYGHNDTIEPEMIQINEKAMRRYLEDGRKFFEVQGTAKGAVQAFVAEVQVNELTDELLHVDFQRVQAGDRVKLKIPLAIKGTPAGARIGGRLEVFLHNIRISCTPENILEELVLDVSKMEVGDRATLEGLDLPEGVLPIGQGSTTVCIIHPPKGARGPKKAEEGGDEPAAGEDTPDEPAAS